MVHPCQVTPPHCPYSAAVQVADDVAELDVTEVLNVVAVEVAEQLLLVAPPEPPVSFRVTTPYAGTDTVTAPHDRAAVVELRVLLLSVTQAAALAAVKPEKVVLMLCALPPELMSTTTTEPSVFL